MRAAVMLPSSRPVTGPILGLSVWVRVPRRLVWPSTAPISGWRTKAPFRNCRKGGTPQATQKRRDTHMKQILFAVALGMATIGGLAQAQLTFNPNQVAILRWYQGNQ